MSGCGRADVPGRAGSGAGWCAVQPQCRSCPGAPPAGQAVLSAFSGQVLADWTGCLWRAGQPAAGLASMTGERTASRPGRPIRRGRGQGTLWSGGAWCLGCHIRVASRPRGHTWVASCLDRFTRMGSRLGRHIRMDSWLRRHAGVGWCLTAIHGWHHASAPCPGGLLPRPHTQVASCLGGDARAGSCRCCHTRVALGLGAIRGWIRAPAAKPGAPWRGAGCHGTR